MRDVIIEYCLPMATEGLRALEIDTADIDNFLGVIAARAASGRNGTNWQGCAAWIRRPVAGGTVHATAEHRNSGARVGNIVAPDPGYDPRRFARSGREPTALCA